MSDNQNPTPNANLPAVDSGAKSSQGQEEFFELSAENDLPVHAAARHFQVTSKQLREMTESMRTHGQMDPVTVLEEDTNKRSILDGQTRNAARKELGIGLSCRLIKPAQLDGKLPLEWVIARNMAAGSVRHLSDSARALLAARLVRDVYAPAALVRMKAGKADGSDEARSHEKAAVALNVKPNRVRQALKVLGSPELDDAVSSGEVVISTAAKIADLTDRKRRLEALSAAKEKDKERLKSILGENSTSESESSTGFFNEASWNKNLTSYREFLAWLTDISAKPEGRVIRGEIDLKMLEAVAASVDASRPHVACPYCEYAAGQNCPVCDGSGWLTEAEHKRHIEAAMRDHHRVVAAKSSPAGQ